jgi:hypothetical protein
MKKDRPVSAASCVAAMVLLYCLLYEWGNISDLAVINTSAQTLKLILPAALALIVLCGSPSPALPGAPLARRYLAFFALFMAWGLLPSMFSGHVHETMLQWLKFVPRLVFCYLIFLYLLNGPDRRSGIMKGLVLIALGAVLQYALLSILYKPDDMRGFAWPVFRTLTYYGPYGLLGSGTAVAAIGNNQEVMLFRLTGFWLEPSPASGFLLASFFLAQALFEQTRQLRWRLSGLVCLIGGLATFSNAAVFSLGCALLSGSVIRMKEAKRGYLGRIFVALVMLAVMFFAVFGRIIVVAYFKDNIFLRFISGTRQLADPYGGRIGLLISNLKTVLQHPLGIGFRIAGRDASGAGFDFAGVAPVLWLVTAGWIGLSLLLLRESQVVLAMRRSPLTPVSVAIFQAWVAVFAQNLAYGTWMTPLYFVLAAMVFSAAFASKDAAPVPPSSPV